jgi:hypothetical protein
MPPPPPFLPLSTSLKLVAGARVIVGLSSWLLPYHASKFFAFLTLQPQSTILMRLFGVRELALAGLLVAAGTEAERRRVVVAGLVVDSMDALASLVGFGLGEQDGVVAGMVGVGAAILVGLGLLG